MGSSVCSPEKDLPRFLTISSGVTCISLSLLGSIGEADIPLRLFLLSFTLADLLIVLLTDASEFANDFLAWESSFMQFYVFELSTFFFLFFFLATPFF